MTDPMELAKAYVALASRKRDLEAQLGDAKRKMAEVEPDLLQAIEEGRFPESSRVDGMTVFLRRSVWASPKDGDYERACALLTQAGLGDYVQTRFNTQSMSAYVRDLEREGEPIPPLVEDALKITEKFEVQARAS